jgi:hypothetical protein
LYNTLTKPPTFKKVDNESENNVSFAYRTAPFINEANKMVYLSELYEKYTADLFSSEMQKKK